MKPRIVTLPLSPGPPVRVALVSMPPQMTAPEWRQFHSVLDVMEPALTHDPMPSAFGPGYLEPPIERRVS